MAEAGQIINWSNFNHSTTKSYDSGEQKLDDTDHIYLYVSAQSFCIHLSCNSALLVSASFSCTFSYYNFSDNTWNTYTTITGSCKGSGKADDKYFYLNFNGNNTPTDDFSKHTLWECNFTADLGSSYCTARIRGDAGGPGCCSESQYNTYCKGKPIMSAGSLDGDSFHANTVQDRDNALTYFKYTNGKSSQLKADYQHKFIAKWW